MNNPPASVQRSPLVSLLLALLVPLVAWSLYDGWARWSDAQIDFGRELYVPWRLLQGEHLYRDIAYFNGPLSAYFNALCFRLLGVSYWTLVACNALLLTAFCGFLWRSLRSALPADADPLCSVSFLLFSSVAFFFGQQTLCGNYNFLSPYSHEATHGLMLGLLAMVLAWRGSASRWRCFFIGLLLGLVFLTKVELFVASAGSVAYLLLRRDERPAAMAGLPGLLAGALLPGALFLVLLSTQMPLAQAAGGVLGGWPHLLSSGASELPFYRSILGLDAPGANALAMLLATGLLSGVLLVGGLLARWAPQAGWLSMLLFLVSYYAWRVAGQGALAPSDWLARSLPLATLLLLAAGPLLRGRISGLGVALPWRRFQALVLFGCLLLGKMLLNARFAHYGFFLCLPASAALLCFGLEWLPRLIGAQRRHLVACVLGAYGAAGASLLGNSGDYFGIQTISLGKGADATWSDFRAQEISAALIQIEQRLGADQELLVLPEGVNLNYLARRRTATRMINFMPLELLLFGEPSMLAELREDPPAAVLLLHKDTSEYGYAFFGRDYGLELHAWVLANYRLTWSASRGGEVLAPGTVFGAALYELKRP